MATENGAPAVGGRWLAMVAQLPTDDPSGRMRVLRTLEGLGAAVMREGVYLLPQTPENRHALDGLAEYVGKIAGSAHVLLVEPTEAQDAAFRRLFDRSARYAALVKTIEGLKLGYGVSDPSAISRVLHKQRRDLEAIGALDFFPSEARSAAERALHEAEAAVKKLLFPTEQTQSQTVPLEKLLGRTWATRKPLWADRLACAWLVRRFIDPEAKMAWLEKGQDAADGVIGYGYEGAQFANSATQVTFEQMLAAFGQAQNAALMRIGGIIHSLEARDAPVAEAAGVQTLLQGAVRRAANEDELLAEAEKTLDLLYEAYCEPAPVVKPA